MIAGETEAILSRYGEDYDDFFGLFKKKKRTPEEEAERKEKRTKFWSDVTTTIKDLAALSITPTPGTTVQAQMPQTSPVDYQFSFGSEDPGVNQIESPSNKEDDKDDKDKGWPILPIAIGTLVVIGAAYWGYTALKKANQLNT